VIGEAIRRMPARALIDYYESVIKGARRRPAGRTAARALEIANAAKAGCPISRLLKAQITMDTKREA
jgi:organic hydroperoxide reductase OsmC/OhrA